MTKSKATAIKKFLKTYENKKCLDDFSDKDLDLFSKALDKLDVPKGFYELSIKLTKEDKKRVGKSNYRGLAFFWHQDYKHLRDKSRKSLVRVHSNFLKKNLAVGESSLEHDRTLKIRR